MAWEVWNLESKAEREARLKKQRLESGYDFIMEDYHDRMTCYSLADGDVNKFKQLYYEVEIDIYYEMLAYKKALNWSADG